MTNNPTEFDQDCLRLTETDAQQVRELEERLKNHGDLYVLSLVIHLGLLTFSGFFYDWVTAVLVGVMILQFFLYVVFVHSTEGQIEKLTGDTEG